ncbi:Separin [Dermatophagoides farinae]|uniref:separase n=1 Tax=Dermatophagoides farinae TaxID=6954 RepID=A0A922HRW7_DERFA|nr:Separin [Dermatophagoides farinae]
MEDKSTPGTCSGTSKSRRSTKCPLFESILKQAIWLKKQGITSQTYDQQILDTIIDNFHEHLDSGCFCVARSFTYIALATTYLEKFYSMFQSSVLFMTEHESRLHKIAEEIRKEKEKNFINDLDVNDGSSFIAENNDIVNVSNFNRLMEHSFNAFRMYEKGLQLARKEENIVNWKFLDRFGFLTNMNALFQIFSYYHLDIYAFKVLTFALTTIDQYYPQQQHSLSGTALIAVGENEIPNENIVLIQCNLLRLLLKFGFIKMAASYYKRFFGQMKFFEMINNEDIEWINSFERCMIFLVYCEISLRTRNGKQISIKLKQLIQSNYLQKSTIKRFLIKSMANSLATHFPSINYQFENYMNEFIEPTQMSVGMCRRWKFFAMFFPNTNTNQSSNIYNDLWWIRFAVLNIFSNTFETFLDFNLNNGMNCDPVFYYKLAVNLFTVTMNLFSLGKLRLTGAIYDINNTFYMDAKIKMILFKKIFHGHSKCNDEIFKISPTPESFDVENDLKIDLKLNDLNNIDNDNDDNEEEDPNSINVIYKRLRKFINHAHHNGDMDDLKESNFYHENIPIEKLSSSFIKDFQQSLIHLQKDSIFYLFQLYILHAIIVNMLIYNETKNALVICRERYLSLLNFFEYFNMKIVIPELNRKLKSGNNNSYKIIVKTTMDEQIMNGPIEKLFWIWNTFFIEVLIQHDKYLEAWPFLHRLIDISTYSYSSRMQRSQMFYYQALVLYKQLKRNKNNDEESKKMFKLITHHLVVDNFQKDLNSLEKLSTPSPKNRKKASTMTNASAIFEAPKKRDPLGSAEKEYKKSLMDKIQSSRHVIEGTRRINDFKFDDDDDDDGDLDPVNDNNKDDNGSINIPKIESSDSVTTTSRSHTNKEKFKIFIDQDCQDHQDYVNLNESLSKIFSMLTIVDRKNETTNTTTTTNETATTDLYFNKFFNFDNEMNDNNGNYNPDSITNEDVKLCLKKAISYIGCHPGHRLYSQLHYLFYKLYKLMAKSNQILCFHLAETAPYHCFRYRLLFNTYKKINSSKSPQYNNLELIRFKNEDFAYNAYVSILPKSWRFVQVKLIENGKNNPDLLLCRFQNGYQPYFLKIKSDQQKDIKFFMEEFAQIMKLNSISIHETDKKSFWRMRFETDFQLKNLLDITEKHVFGLARGFFMGQTNNRKYIACCTGFRRSLFDLAKEMKISCQDYNLLNIFIESIVLFTAEEAEIAAQILFTTNDDKFLKRFEELRKKYFTSWMKNDKLKQLFEDIEPVGLIIDQSLNQFPFESLPSLRQKGQPFFRIPSMKIAALLYEKYKQLQTFLSIKEWTGFVGTVPEGKNLAENFETKDIYVYMGHGSGSQYYRSIPNGFDVVNINSLSIVVGCSSGRVTKETKTSDVFGSAYRFLINGAPVYIGALWDVTDKDIDIYMNEFMSLWLPRWNREQQQSRKKNNSLCKSISLARDSCKLRYLNGCASVVYGLPLKNRCG